MFPSAGMQPLGATMTDEIRKPTFSVYLRGLRLEDVESIWRWHNNEDLYTNLIGECHRPAISQTEIWLKQQLEFNKDRLSFAVCTVDSDKHIGNVYLRDIEHSSDTAEFHIFIGDIENRGRRYGHQALQIALDHAFNTLGLKKITLKVLESNAIAIRIYKKSGFIEDRREIKSVKKNGTFQDVICMSLLNESKKD